MTRILLSIPARPDCRTAEPTLLHSQRLHTATRIIRLAVLNNPITHNHQSRPRFDIAILLPSIRYVIRAKRARDEKKEARARPGVPGRFFTNSLSSLQRPTAVSPLAASPTAPTPKQHSKTRRRPHYRPLSANLATTKRGCVVATSPSPSQSTARLSAKCTDPGPGQTFDTHRNGNEHEPTLGL